MFERFGLTTAARRVTERGRRMVELEVELAKAEMREKAQRYGAGIGFGLGAAILALFALGFGLATAAVALSLVVDTWLALLIVFVLLLTLTLTFSLLARSFIKKAGKPVPQTAIDEARLTAATVRANGSQAVATPRGGGDGAA